MIVVFSAIIEAAICFVVVFGDIGFDHPGRFGLDFEHFLLMMIVQLASVTPGL